MIGGFAKCGTGALFVNLARDPRFRMVHEHGMGETYTLVDPEQRPHDTICGCKDVGFTAEGGFERYKNDVHDKDLSPFEIILCVRHPIQRIESHYYFKHTSHHKSFLRFCLDNDDESINASQYMKKINELLPYILQENLHIVIQERLAHNIEQEIRSVYHFLGLKYIPQNYQDQSHLLKYRGRHFATTLYRNYDNNYTYVNDHLFNRQSDEYKQAIDYIKQKTNRYTQELKDFLNDDLSEWDEISQKKGW